MTLVCQFRARVSNNIFFCSNSLVTLNLLQYIVIDKLFSTPGRFFSSVYMITNESISVVDESHEIPILNSNPFLIRSHKKTKPPCRVFLIRIGKIWIFFLVDKCCQNGQHKAILYQLFRIKITVTRLGIQNRSLQICLRYLWLNCSRTIFLLFCSVVKLTESDLACLLVAIRCFSASIAIHQSNHVWREFGMQQTWAWRAIMERAPHSPAWCWPFSFLSSKR